MKYRTKIMSLTILLVVFFATYISGLFMMDRSTLRQDEALPLLPGISPDEVSSLEFFNDGGSYILSRGEEQSWFISESAWEGGRKRFPDGTLLPGDGGRIEPFITDLLNCGREVVVTDDPEKYSQFEVEDGGIPRMTVHAPGKSMTLLFGKADPAGMGEYVRVKGENEVVLTSRMSMYVNRNIAYWGDLSILPDTVTEENIVSMKFEWKKKLDPTAEKEAYALLKTGTGNEETWILTGSDTPPDPRVIERLIRNLVHLKGNDFAAGPFPPESEGNPVLAEIKIITAAGEEYCLSAAPYKDEDTLIVSLSGRNLLLEIKKSVIRRVLLEKAELYG